ncbi:hypothetical protein [Geoalkalibacter halelectricus]|uniref:hypothetical protein n=1 Tax=Geoalkalibacter halelectricus TaxID=2847045 RepID=UPI003D1D3769
MTNACALVTCLKEKIPFKLSSRHIADSNGFLYIQNSIDIACKILKTENDLEIVDNREKIKIAQHLFEYEMPSVFCQSEENKLKYKIINENSDMLYLTPDNVIDLLSQKIITKVCVDYAENKENYKKSEHQIRNELKEKRKELEERKKFNTMAISIPFKVFDISTAFYEMVGAKIFEKFWPEKNSWLISFDKYNSVFSRRSS